MLIVVVNYSCYNITWPMHGLGHKTSSMSLSLTWHLGITQISTIYTLATKYLFYKTLPGPQRHCLTYIAHPMLHCTVHAMMIYLCNIFLFIPQHSMWPMALLMSQTRWTGWTSWAPKSRFGKSCDSKHNFEHWSSQTNDLKIDDCHFRGRHFALLG